VAFTVDVAECGDLSGDEGPKIADVTGADLVAGLAADVEGAQLGFGDHEVGVGVGAGDQIKGDARFARVEIVIKKMVGVDGDLGGLGAADGELAAELAGGIAGVGVEGPGEGVGDARFGRGAERRTSEGRGALADERCGADGGDRLRGSRRARGAL